MVSETEVTEDQESQAIEAKDDEEDAKDIKTSQSIMEERSSNLVFDTDDAMASVDPYGTNIYKGVKLSNTNTTVNEVRPLVAY